VHCGLKTAGQCFAELVSGHKQALAMRDACGMKFKLLRVRLVVFETVLS
jgi:hypothetical protein